jgi:hypothetical protein
VTAPISDEDLLRQLVEGELFAFRDWPISAVPKVAAGVYTIWEAERLVYVGMSGQGGGASADALMAAEHRGRPWGLATRLRSHASGRRSGDQFCIYVADFLVLPDLRSSDIEMIASRRARFDDMVKRYIWDRLSFRFVVTESGQRALELERLVKAGALDQRPFLNPLE